MAVAVHAQEPGEPERYQGPLPDREFSADRPLTAAAREALQAEHAAQLKARLAAGPRWQPVIENLCFTTAVGQPRNGAVLGHGLSTALKAAGLPAMHSHHLRHVFAGAMLASGSDIATVSRLLGHSDISVTASVYAAVTPSLKWQAAERLESWLGR